MQQKAQEADYTIEREFLGDITVTELVEQIIRSHLFPSSDQEAALSQKERHGNYNEKREPFSCGGVYQIIQRGR